MKNETFFCPEPFIEFEELGLIEEEPGVLHLSISEGKYLLIIYDISDSKKAFAEMYPTENPDEPVVSVSMDIDNIRDLAFRLFPNREDISTGEHPTLDAYAKVWTFLYFLNTYLMVSKVENEKKELVFKDTLVRAIAGLRERDSIKGV